jgi:hypothetical protein
MANQYDRIFKETGDISIPSLAEKLFDLDVEWREEVKDKVQATLEREGDYLIKGIVAKTKKETLLQFEFEGKASRIKAKRLLLYYGMFYDKYELPVQQYVIYVGKRPLPRKIDNEIKSENLNFRFDVKDIRSLSYDTFLGLNKPEEIIWAVLANFKGEPIEEIAGKILKRLRETTDEQNISFAKSYFQLLTISNIRNLRQVLKQKYEKMKLTLDYDPAKDPFFKALSKEVRQTSLLEGREEGRDAKQDEFIFALLEDGEMPIPKIAKLVGVSIEYVLEKKAILDKKK